MDGLLSHICSLPGYPVTPVVFKCFLYIYDIYFQIFACEGAPPPGVSVLICVRAAPAPKAEAMLRGAGGSLAHCGNRFPSLPLPVCGLVRGPLPLCPPFSFNIWVVCLKWSFSVGSFLVLLKCGNENVLQTALIETGNKRGSLSLSLRFSPWF